MKELLRRTRAWMCAVAFAEAGEWDTARELMPASEANRQVSWLERQFAAVAFAEADLQMAAVEVAEGSGPAARTPGLDVLAECGLRGIYLSFGTVSISELD